MGVPEVSVDLLNDIGRYYRPTLCLTGGDRVERNHRFHLLEALRLDSSDKIEWQGNKDSNLGMLESKSSALTSLAIPLHNLLLVAALQRQAEFYSITASTCKIDSSGCRVSDLAFQPRHVAGN